MLDLRRYLNVVYFFIVEFSRRGDRALHETIKMIDEILAPPPTVEELEVIEAKANADAMRALTGMIGAVPGG